MTVDAAWLPNRRPPSYPRPPLVKSHRDDGAQDANSKAYDRRQGPSTESPTATYRRTRSLLVRASAPVQLLFARSTRMRASEYEPRSTRVRHTLRHRNSESPTRKLPLNGPQDNAEPRLVMRVRDARAEISFDRRRPQANSDLSQGSIQAD